jgi:hypothetical protein
VDGDRDGQSGQGEVEPVGVHPTQAVELGQGQADLLRGQLGKVAEAGPGDDLVLLGQLEKCRQNEGVLGGEVHELVIDPALKLCPVFGSTGGGPGLRLGWGEEGLPCTMPGT